MSEVTRTGDQVRGQLVDRKRIHWFEEVGLWLEERTEGGDRDTGGSNHFAVFQCVQRRELCSLLSTDYLVSWFNFFPALFGCVSYLHLHQTTDGVFVVGIFVVKR